MVLVSIMALILGAIITGLVAKHYYERASDDLKKEAAELRRLNQIVLLGLENAEILNLSKDEKGNIQGLSITLKVQNVSHATKVSKAEITK